MRNRSDKDKGATAVPTGTVQQIASTNSTANLFLGGSRVRSWMNGTASSTSTEPHAKQTSALPSKTINRPPPPPTTTSVLPSPAPSDEPSPATQEANWSSVVQEEQVGLAARLPLMTFQGADIHAGERAVRRPDAQGELAMVQREAMDDGRWVLRSSPSTQLPSLGTRQTQTRAGSQGGMAEQGQAYIEPRALQSPDAYSQQSSQRDLQGHANNEPQAMRSPSTQQPPPTIQQGHTYNGPQAVQSPSTRPVVNAQYSHPAPTPAPPAKRRKMTSANHPTLKTLIPIIKQYVHSCGGLGTIRGIERQRFNMLEKACENDDYFYVALHQIFCLWSLDPHLAIKLTMPQGEVILEVSLSIVGQLIIPNTSISEAHTKFFSTFPNSLSELMYRSDQYSLTVNNVAIFLARLSIEWPKYIPTCVQRGYPPLVDELVNQFGLLSPILQHIIFTATRRNIGFQDDEYGAQMEQVFNHDVEAHRQMAARVNTAYPPTAREIKERNEWQVSRYLAIRQMQSQVTRPPMGSDSARPSQPDLPGRVQPPSNTPSAAQAGQLPRIRTNVLPSEVLTASPRSTTASSPYNGPWPSQAQVSARQTPNGSVSEHSSQPPMPNTIRRQSSFQASQGYPMSPNQQSMQHPYQPNQMQNMQHRLGQVNDVTRTASRNASRNASLSQFPGAGSAGSGSAGSSPVLTNLIRHNNAAPTLAAMRAGQRHMEQQQQQHVGRIPLIPPVGYIPPYQLPQPDCNALHQAYLRSPVLRPAWVEKDQPAEKLYQAVQSLAAGPTTLLDPPLLTELSFAVPTPAYCNIAEDKLDGPTAPPIRELRQGSLQYRIRCCRLNSGTQMEPWDFVVADTNWPPTIFMEMNDSVLEIKRKGHYGKDRPVDITPHVFVLGPDKKNMLRISVPRPPKMGTGNDIMYAIAIEVVEVFRHQQIVDMCLKEQRITAKDMIEDIKAKLSNTADDDDEVALVSANLTIDLADPFTSRIFTTPVRGAKCRHRECFDLETFLISRSSKPREVACPPDVWKCPLCGGDASPRSLRVDDFLVSVREKLEKDGDLDVKAILVTEDGSWTKKAEAPPAARRKSRGPAGSVPRDEGEYASPAVQSRQGSRTAEVIELDDD